MTFSFPALVLTRRALPALVLFDFQKEKESHVGLQAMSTIQKKKIGLEHVSNIISQKTSNSFSDYQPKGYLKRHNLIHVFFNQAFSKFIIHKQRPRILQFLSYE